MFDIDIGWFAGIIDGEGTISLDKKNKSEWRYPRISVSSTDIEILQKCRDVTCTGTIRPKKETRPNCKPSWVWKVDSTNEVIRLLSNIIEHLACPSKRKRARLVLDNYKKLTSPNGRYSEEMKKAKMEFQSKFLAS